jgi:hypothetical protein
MENSEAQGWMEFAKPSGYIFEAHFNLLNSISDEESQEVLIIDPQC